MAYTSHGHHIPGTDTENPPSNRARCGGPQLCSACGREAFVFSLSNNEKKVLGIKMDNKKSLPLERSFDLEKEKTALGLVKAYILEHLDKSEEIPDFKVYIVMSGYVLGDWKMEISSSLPDGMYYEVTFNQTRDEIYLDAYKKIENVRIEC